MSDIIINTLDSLENKSMHDDRLLLEDDVIITSTLFSLQDIYRVVTHEKSKEGSPMNALFLFDGIEMKGGGRTMEYELCCSGSACNPRVDYRRFLTREEKIEMLQEYKEALEKEAKGVAERIQELEKA